MAALTNLVAIVLVDGPTLDALDSVRSARTLTDSVVVVDATDRPWPTLGAGVAVAPFDWHVPGALRTILDRLHGRWVLVLNAGEIVRVTDPAALAAAPAGETVLGVLMRKVWRGRLLLAGSAPASSLDRPAAPSGLTVERPHAAGRGGGMDEIDTSDATVGRVVAAMPIGMRNLGGLAAALEGGDLDAVETLQCHLEAVEERRLLEIVRDGRDVCWLEPDDEAEPLVSIRIATYHRPELIGKAIESCLRQTYERIEILVVGDHCSPETEAVVRSFHDPRLTFLNLPSRGIYPTEMMAKWRVAGSHPMNTAITLARGSWITACDDDDEFSDDHVEVLLAHAKQHRLEMVYSNALVEVEPDKFIEVGSVPLRCGEIAHGAVLYSLGLRYFRLSNTCWRNEMPADFHLWQRMERAGVRIGFLDRITYVNRLQTHRRTPAGSTTP